MRAVRYSMMLNTPTGQPVAIIDKTPRECCCLIQEHIKDEYGFDMDISYIKLYDVIRGKSKNTLLSHIIMNVNKKHLTRDEVQEYKNRGIALF